MVSRGIVVALGLALGACGGDAEPAEREAGRDGAAADRRAVQERTATYLRAYLGGDGPVACAQLSPALRRSVDARAKAAGGTCATALGAIGPKLLATLPAEQREAFTASVTDAAEIRVELDGDAALAGFAPAGEGRVPARLKLERSGDRWLIAELGAQAPPAP